MPWGPAIEEGRWAASYVPAAQRQAALGLAGQIAQVSDGLLDLAFDLIS